jgi:DNA processing protein
MTGSGAQSSSRLSDEQLTDVLCLIRSENVGPRTFRQLINRYGGARAALEALPDLAARSAQGRPIRIADRSDVIAEIERSRALGVLFLAMSDPDYPPLLREIDSAPPVIAVRGEVKSLRCPCVAIVGSRNASAAGLAFTKRLARGLAREDYVLVSGLARGVDAAAHRASLESGTVAVLAGGHARPYPAEHAELIEEIVQSGRGAVVSEMPLEWEPRGRDFPRRNRIVSGLSVGTVVVEAARRSGSLITAHFAVEQGREVFAVPGSPLDPRAEGTNDLLRQGATLCAGPEDVIQVLAERVKGKPPPSDLFKEAEGYSQQEPLFDELDLLSLQEGGAANFGCAFPADGDHLDAQPAEICAAGPIASSPAVPELLRDPLEIVTSLLGPSPIAIDELIRAAGLSAREVQGVLIELDLAGRIERHGASLVSLI